MQSNLPKLAVTDPKDNDLPFVLDWSWDSSVSNITYNELLAWCLANYGGYNGSVRWRGYLNSGSIQFIDEKDMLLFLLRWK